MSKNTDICIYARYSTDRQDARSIDDQVRRCTEYAKNHALTVGTVFPDAAISGSHVERDELKKMLAEAESLRTRSFNAVIVDDLARLSRDLFDMGRIVFQDLLALDVRVIDAMSGISSDHPMARQIFAAMGMGNDAFLQLVRSETHRGLQGRAIAGFWTGGRVFGYRTIPEPNPPDPEHVRKLLVIDETTSKIVVLIFTLFHEGYGLGAISDRLNRDGIPAPYDNLAKLTKKQGRGWATEHREGDSPERALHRPVHLEQAQVRAGAKEEVEACQPSTKGGVDHPRAARPRHRPHRTLGRHPQAFSRRVVPVHSEPPTAKTSRTCSRASPAAAPVVPASESSGRR
jgi:DNA invertase Pin-like site-specific DNA recombinase